MPKIITILLILLLTSPAYSATYYMRADGTAVDKSGATSCSSASTAMSVATHNGETFSAADIINLCDDGGEYTATITLPSSGTSGNEIVYQSASGDSPVIDGSVAIAGTFTNTAGNEYKVSYATEPTEIYNGTTQIKGGLLEMDNTWTTDGTEWYNTTVKWCPNYVVEDPTGTPVYLTEGSAVGSLNSNEWYCDAGNTNRFYVKPSSGNPDGKGAGYITLSVTKAGSLNAGEYFWDESSGELHVRLADSSDPTGQLTVSSLTNCINATDKEYITIRSDIICQKVSGDGTLYTFTANKSGFTFDDITIQYTGLSNIAMDIPDGITVSPVTITDSTLLSGIRSEHFLWTAVLSREMGGITLGDIDAHWGDQGIVDVLTIQRNKIDYGTQDISQSNFDAWMASGNKSGIYVSHPTNITMTDNEIIGYDHQVFFQADTIASYDAGTSIVKRNYIYDGYDDAAWLHGFKAGSFVVSANKTVTNGDDNWDNGASTIIEYYNNTSINGANDGSCLESTVSGAQGTYKNNTCTFATSIDCATGTHCFIRLGSAGKSNAADWTFANNLYYYDGSDVDSFNATDLDTGDYLATFAEWQADDAGVDANTIINNPILDGSYITTFYSPLKNRGYDACADGIDELLTENSTWTVGQTVETFNPCPMPPNKKYPIGAFYIGAE